MAALAVFGANDSLARSQTGDTLQIGTSVEGRPIEVTCFGSGDPLGDERVVLIVGAIHAGFEAVTADLAHELIDDFADGRLAAPPRFTACILPELNPDGLARGTHTNANEVDLNRNWPSEDWRSDAWHPVTGAVSGGSRPLSEPETQALYDFIEMAEPSAVIVYHCCGSLVVANRQPDAVFMARRYARAAGFEYVDSWNSYDISGEFIDSMDGLDVPAMDVELRTSGETGLDEHRSGLQAALDYLPNGISR